MKLRSLRLAVLLLAGLNTALAARAPAQPPAADYELLFEDTFKGHAVNEQDWMYRTGPRKGGYIDGLNLKANVTVSDGALHITARHENINGKMENTGGGLISRHEFGYGYYETLSKPFMAGRGVHSAFWQAGGARPNNNLFEIDSYEIDSHSFLGCNNLYVHISPKGFEEVPWPCRAHVPFAFNADGWFLDGYEFTPEGVIFYDNGNIVARVAWPELTARQVVWLTALNGCGKVDADKLPGETTFKYFRYYAKDYPGINLLPNGNFEYNQDKVDPAKPVCWVQEGTPKAGVVIKDQAFRDHYKLRHALSDGPYQITTRQSLEFIRNGDYQLSAMVRSSGGQQTAQLRAADFGGAELAVDIPASTAWTKISIPNISVTNHSVTVAITSKAAAGQWLEIDDVQFAKPPLPGQKLTPPPPFVLIGDPIWKIAGLDPITFTGDGKFYLFDRNVGLGDAITVAFRMTPARVADMAPIARQPKTGDAGWTVELTGQGQVVFRVGSAATHQNVVAPASYATDTPTHVACVYDQGTVRIYIDGALKKEESGITFTTLDTTAPGRMGRVDDIYDAVEGVLAPHDAVAPTTTRAAKLKKFESFVGSLQDVRVYNRALGTPDIQALAAAARKP